MLKLVLLAFFVQLSWLGHAQVIADHRVVDIYEDIPQRWIDSVKTKLVWAHGMSHGYGYFRGAELLEQMDSSFQVNIWYHTDPPAYQDTAMRLGRPGFGRESHWTSQGGIDNFNSYDVARQNDDGNPYDFIWFGWSYQGTWENGLGGGNDPVHNVQWAGSTQSGTDGNKRWGLDSGDSILTENRVCMDTYLDAAEQFNQFYKDEGYETKYFFSNGISDGNEGSELGFQRELKNQHIRDYVYEHGDENTYFLDYSDILVHDSAGVLHMVDWTDEDSIRPHQQIHPDNKMDYDEDFNIVDPGTDEIEDHIGEVGAVRLAKAMWWLMARACGWDGIVPDSVSPSVPSGLALLSVSSDSVIFSWKPSSDKVGVTAYNIYRNELLLGNTGDTIYLDKTMPGCGNYSYTVAALDASGNESAQSSGLDVNNCIYPDLTLTLMLSPNIVHGVTDCQVIVRVVELNSVASSGEIVVNIPKNTLWGLSDGYVSSLTELGTTILDNGDWAYTEDAEYHIFKATGDLGAAGSSVFGFMLTFDPGGSSGEYIMTAQLVPGSGGEIRLTNNSDKEQLDYFQE